MDPSQFDRLMQFFRSMEPTLKQIASPTYTLTQAQDWPLLLIMFSVIAFLLMIIIGMIGVLWKNTGERLDKDNTVVHARINKLEAEHLVDVKSIIEELKTTHKEIEKCRAHCYYGRRKEDIDDLTD